MSRQEMLGDDLRAEVERLKVCVKSFKEKAEHEYKCANGYHEKWQNAEDRAERYRCNLAALYEACQEFDPGDPELGVDAALVAREPSVKALQAASDALAERCIQCGAKGEGPYCSDLCKSKCKEWE